MICPTVEADPIHMTQLFDNLIGNAIKYRKADECPRITVKAEARRNACVFSVEDNGQGMDRKYLAPYLSAATAFAWQRSAWFGESGLRLRRLWIGTAGGFGVQSEPGKGSNVSVHHTVFVKSRDKKPCQSRRNSGLALHSGGQSNQSVRSYLHGICPKFAVAFV